MPAHDWTRVLAGTFHAFHTAWITHLAESLNRGILPDEYHALPEQHAGQLIADVLTLSKGQPDARFHPARGATAVADAPPQASVHMTVGDAAGYRLARRTLTIRHRTGRRVVAMVEIVSPGNKDSRKHLEQFVDKSSGAIQHGVHQLVVDLHPPGSWDPHGIHAAIWEVVGGVECGLPPETPLVLAAYQADQLPEAFVEPFAVGQPLKDMPIFLSADWYVSAPLENTYMAAYAGLPSVVKDVVEGRSPPEGQ